MEAFYCNWLSILCFVNEAIIGRYWKIYQLAELADSTKDIQYLVSWILSKIFNEKQNVSESKRYLLSCLRVSKKFWFSFELRRQLAKTAQCLDSFIVLVFRYSIKCLVQRHLLNSLLFKESNYWVLKILTFFSFLY